MDRRPRPNAPRPARATRGRSHGRKPVPLSGEGRENRKRILVAQIGAPHGVRGELRLKAFTTDPLALAEYGPLETEDGARRFKLLSLRPAKDMLVARIEGVADRDAAELLKHLRLYVPRERLPKIDEEETWYHADLVGLAVDDRNGNAFGVVAAIHNYGAGDVIEIAPTGGGPTLLVPFTKSAVPVVDVAGGRLVIDAEAYASGLPPENGAY